MNTADWLQFFGIIYAVVGIALILKPKILKGALKEIPHNKAATLSLAFMALVIGAAILSSHFRFDSLGASLVTLIGMIATIEGFIYLAYPEIIKQFRPWFKQENHIQATGFFCLFFGVGALTIAIRAF